MEIEKNVFFKIDFKQNNPYKTTSKIFSFFLFFGYIHLSYGGQEELELHMAAIDKITKLNGQITRLKTYPFRPASIKRQAAQEDNKPIYTLSVAEHVVTPYSSTVKDTSSTAGSNWVILDVTEFHAIKRGKPKGRSHSIHNHRISQHLLQGGIFTVTLEQGEYRESYFQMKPKKKKKKKKPIKEDMSKKVYSNESFLDRIFGIKVIGDTETDYCDSMFDSEKSKYSTYEMTVRRLIKEAEGDKSAIYEDEEKTVFLVETSGVDNDPSFILAMNKAQSDPDKEDSKVMSDHCSSKAQSDPDKEDSAITKSENQVNRVTGNMSDLTLDKWRAGIELRQKAQMELRRQFFYNAPPETTNEQ